MPLEPDEKREVSEMIHQHFKDEVLPLHRENLGVLNSFRSELQELKYAFNTFISELRGAEKERKDQVVIRDQKIANSTRNSQWTLVMVTLLCILVTAIGIYVAYRAATTHTTPAVVGHDSSISQEN